MYDSPHQFEPLLPQFPEPLVSRAGQIARDAALLAGAAHPASRQVIRELVRSMNSYYSNRIEGQGSHPWDIERALRNDFSEKPGVAQLQRLALAHIEAEKDLEQMVEGGQSPLTAAFLQNAHRALYGRLSIEDRTTKEGMVVQPGEIRTKEVYVGDDGSGSQYHLAPKADSLPRFHARLDEVYARSWSWDMQLIIVACLHHRAAWVHPFIDGNGRSIRLQSHCALWKLSHGLWSPSRGLARNTKNYYAHLRNADGTRRGDLDGRGNLTLQGFIGWIDYFLDVCSDQVTFMTRMLDLDDMKRRIEALIMFRSAHDKEIRREAVLPMHHVFAAGPVARGEFQQMTGLGERTARALLASLLKCGLVESATPSAPVHWALPLDALQFLFPGLYPEVDVKPE